MAARWRGKDGELNTGISDFMASNTLNELVLSRAAVEGVDMDTPSCVDHSILAILEDSTIAPLSECKNRAEEESEHLLSALTEMLDSVEDDGSTLSPFDTLPDTKLLSHTKHRDNTVESSFSHRLRPRSKTPTTASTMKSDGEKGQKGKTEKNALSQTFKLQSQMFHSKNKKADAEVEVFTSTSLVSLVKLMHPYCLKLHVEEGDKLRTHPAIFSQEEVLRYERPTEESDEEINVVSDDEAPVRETKKGDEVDGSRDSGQVLKSVLLNGRSPPSRGKKRVSFGPVQVASLDESVENALNERSPTRCHASETESVPLNSTNTLQNPATEASTTSSDMNCNKTTEDQQPKGQAKAKSLSLQQYRQLRQRRQPLVEKQGNNTTKWPSVPEPPKELTPILCLQKQNSCRPKTAHHYPDLRKPDYMSSCRVSSTHRLQPSEARSSTHSRLNRQSTESKVISPTSPLAGGIVPERKKSPVKKPTPLSSDPPNPVLLPLPVLQIASPSTSNSSSASKVEFSSRDSSLQGNRQLQEIHNESSAATLQRQTFSSELNPQVSALIKDCNQESTALLQDMKMVFTEIPPDDSSTSQEQKTSQCIKPQIQKCSLSSLKDSQPLARTPPALSPDTKRPIKCSSVTPHFSQPLQSHIDASGSATEVQTHSMSPPEEPPPPQSGCRVQGATAGSGIEASDLTSLLEQFEETQAKEEGVCENEPALVRAASLPLMPSVGPLESLSTSETQKLQTLEGMDVPEPLSTEIILSTQQPARRKNPLSKVIQIIDPRPLPSRKTHTTPSESRATRASPHMYAHISSDHDYCGSVDHSPANAFQRSRAKPSLLKDASQTTNDQHMMTQDLNAAGEEKTQITTVLLHHSEQPRTRSEIDKALQFANCATTEDNRTSGNKTAPCTFPTPPPSPPVRGREKRRYRRRSPRSDSSSGSRSSSSSSSSSSASRSPKRLRLHHKRSESSSCSSSPSCSVSRSPPRRYRSRRYTSRSSRSRSRSWSTSRSRSPSPQICCRRWRDFCSSRESRKLRREHDMRIQKLKAIDERRVVYVGRIRRSMTHDELRERFSQFGEVECVSLHFRDRGDHYGFVTFYNMEDAFAAIDNGGKLRQPDELPFDICFGGRRQFCSSDYTDLDANRDAEASPSRTRFEDLDFDSLLKQAQRGSKR